jgi:hypothetical protein
VLVATDFVGDVGIPVCAALLGALLVVLQIRWTSERERSRLKASAQFRVDRFDYAVDWMVGYLEMGQTVPPSVSTLTADYCADLRQALGEAYAESLTGFLTIPEGEKGEITDPQKMLHLAFALVEVRLREGGITREHLLTAKGLRAHLILTLGLHGEYQGRYARDLKDITDSDEQDEGIFVITKLVEASPSCIRSMVANADSLEPA